MFFNRKRVKRNITQPEEKLNNYLVIMTGSFVSSCRIKYFFIKAKDKREVRGWIMENKRKVADSMDNFSWMIEETNRPL